MKNDSVLEFYRGDAVHSILKRYNFSEEERQVVHSAIVTSKKPKVDMSLIAKADRLLKHISTTRKPLASTVKEMDTQKVAAAQAYYASSKDRSKSGKEDRDYKLTLMFLAGMGLIASIAGYISNTYW